MGDMGFQLALVCTLKHARDAGKIASRDAMYAMKRLPFWLFLGDNHPQNEVKYQSTESGEHRCHGIEHAKDGWVYIKILC